MKQLLAALAVFGSLSCFAAMQYGQISSAQVAVDSPNYAAVIDRGGWSHTLQNTMIFNDTSYLYATFTKGNAANYGAYYISGSSKGAEVKLAFTADGHLTAVDGKGKPVAFTHGDAIGFWIEDGAGKTVYNTPGINGQHNYVGTAVTNKNDYVIGFGNYGQYVSSVGGYDQVFKDASYVMEVMIAKDAPVMGQPLPDIFTTLILSSLILGAFLARKHYLAKNTAA